MAPQMFSFLQWMEFCRLTITTPTATRQQKIPETIEDPIEDLDDCDDSSPPSTQYAVLPKLVPGEYGVLRVHPDVTVASLIDLWSQPLQPVAGWQPHQAHAEAT